MSNEILNDSIDLFTPPYQRQIIGFKATVQESVGGVQQVVVHTSQDRMRFVLNLNGLSRTERNSVMEFYRRHKGAQESFLWDDVDATGAGIQDFVSRVSVGTGTGAGGQTTQLKDFDGAHRWNIKTTPAIARVWVNSVEKFSPGDFTLDTTDSGLVTWVFTPGLGHDIENEFYYLRRCRFVDPYGDEEVGYENVNLATLVFDEVIVVP